MSRNWGAMTHAHHLVADGTSRAVVMVDAFGDPLRPPPPRVAPGHKRENPGGPRQNPLPARARWAEAGAEPAVVVERIKVPTSTSTAPLITISNLAGWVGVSAAERSNVDAEIIATNSEFIAVFETQPGDGDAPLGIVCGPVDILPKSVRKVVTARTASAAANINRRKMKFKGRMKETDFLEARYLGSDAGGAPTRLVRVAVTGPMRRRTMTAAMVLVLCARVRFFRAGQARGQMRTSSAWTTPCTPASTTSMPGARATTWAACTPSAPPARRRRMCATFPRRRMCGRPSQARAPNGLSTNGPCTSRGASRRPLPLCLHRPCFRQRTGPLLRGSSASSAMVRVAARLARRPTQPRSSCVQASTACSRRRCVCFFVERTARCQCALVMCERTTNG